MNAKLPRKNKVLFALSIGRLCREKKKGSKVSKVHVGKVR